MKTMLIAALIVGAVPATAHIVAVPASGIAAGYQGVALRVGHGCGDSATTAVRVELPPDLKVVRPQPKPGWTVTIERAPLTPPVVVEGRPQTTRIAAISWAGNLPTDQFDDFGLLIKLPDAAGPVKLPVEQRCGGAVQRWDDSDARHPAPAVDVAPAPPAVPTHTH